MPEGASVTSSRVRLLPEAPGARLLQVACHVYSSRVAAGCHGDFYSGSRGWQSAV